MPNEIDLGPLLAARKQLDDAIQGFKDKIAILHKRRDALQNAIDVMRSTDDEVDAVLAGVKAKKQRVLDVDINALESAILNTIGGYRMSRREIERVLDTKGVRYNGSTIRTVLTTCPHIRKIGERDQTRYFLDPKPVTL